MSIFVADTVEDALRLIDAAIKGEKFDGLESIDIGVWASSDVKLLSGYESEINSPFIDAYSEIQDEIYRLVALAKSGTSDIRVLTQDDLDKYELKVKVEKGSSLFSDNVPALLEKLSVELVGKMSGQEAMIVILGVALLMAAAYGASVFLQSRKEVKLEELRTSERIRAIEALEFATNAQMGQAEEIRRAMAATNEISQRALKVADRSQEEILKAASKTGESVIGGHHITREEARTLTVTARKRSTRKIVEQEMKVVDVNTADRIHTTVILEDPSTEKQFKVTFRDAILEEDARQKVIDALGSRGTSWFRLSAKELDGEAVSYEIIAVIEAPDLPE